MAASDDSLRVALYPRDEIDLPPWVELGVHLIQDVGELEDQLVVFDRQRFVGLGVSEADREPHWSGELDLKALPGQTLTPSPGTGSPLVGSHSDKPCVGDCCQSRT